MTGHGKNQRQKTLEEQVVEVRRANGEHCLTIADQKILDDLLAGNPPLIPPDDDDEDADGPEDDTPGPEGAAPGPDPKPEAERPRPRPKPETETNVKLEADIQTRILAAALKDADFLAECLQLLRVADFENGPIKTAFGIAKEHFEKYRTTPDPWVLRHEIFKANPADKPEEAKTKFADIERAISDYDGKATPYLRDQLVLFAQAQHIRIESMRAIGLLKKGKHAEALAAFENPTKFVNPRAAASGKVPLCEPDEFFSLVKSDYEYVIDGFLPLSKLILTSGNAKAGKTTFLVQMLLQAIDGKWTGKPEDFVFIFLDFENDAGYFKEFIYEPTGYKQSEHPGRFWLINRQLEQPRLPQYITVAYLASLLNFYPGKKVVFLVDSLRRAFGRTPDLPANWEWQASTINTLLDPISEFCHANPCTVIINHHNNKSGTASGSTDLSAVPDVLWSFAPVDKAENDRKITIEGRPSLPTVYVRLKDGCYSLVGGAADYAKVADYDADKADREIMEQICTRLEERPMSGTELVKALGRKKAVETAMTALRDWGITQYDTSLKKVVLLMENWRVPLDARIGAAPSASRDVKHEAW